MEVLEIIQIKIIIVIILIQMRKTLKNKSKRLINKYHIWKNKLKKLKIIKKLELKELMIKKIINKISPLLNLIKKSLIKIDLNHNMNQMNIKALENRNDFIIIKFYCIFYKFY